MTIWDTNSAQALSHDPISPVNFMDQRALPVFADAAAWWRPGANITDPGLDPVRVNTIETSANLFQVLGVSPQLGPGFAPSPLFVPNEPVAVISHRLWRTRYSADPAIVGRQLLINNTAHTVVGVMAPGFHYPDDVDVWQRLIWDMTAHSRAAHFMEAVARLNGDASLEQAQAAVDTLWTQIHRDFSGTRNAPGEGWGSSLVPLLDDQLGYYRPALLVLFGAVGLLMVIAMLNVGSLVLTRSLARGREFAVRIAIGASPLRLAGLLTAEGLILAVAGTLLGVVAAAAALPAIVAWTPVAIPRLADAAIGWRAVALAIGIGALATSAFAAVSGYLLADSATVTTTSGDRGSTRRARTLYAALVVGELALAAVLLVGSGLLVRTVREMIATPLGIDASETVIAAVQLTRSSASFGTPRAQWERVADTHARIVDAVRTQPGVAAAGESNFLPLEIGWRGGVVLPDSAPVAAFTDLPQVQLHSVSDGYFEAMGATPVQGRMFSRSDDRRGAAVAIVNETFVRRYFADRPAVGRAIGLPAGAIGPLGFNLVAASARMAVEIVGVVGDIRNVPLGQTIEPAVYVPTHQFPFSDLQIAVKAASPPAAVAAIREALRSAALEVPMGTARTWGERFGDRTAEPRLLMGVLSAFGVSAGLLAALGVYGLLGWSVSTRSRELAIRLALGAKPRAVGASVVRQAALLVGTGLVIGVVSIRAMTQVLAAVLYQVSAMDMRAITAAAGLLALSALLACLPAAIRAMRVDPAEGLKSE